MRQDPYALEVAHVSVITFGNKAKQTVPLTDIVNFSYSPTDVVEVDLEAGLNLLTNCLSNEVVKRTQERKGDWKPLVFIMIGDKPADGWQKGLYDLRKHEAEVCILVAGQDFDTSILN